MSDFPDAVTLWTVCEEVKEVKEVKEVTTFFFFFFSWTLFNVFSRTNKRQCDVNTAGNGKIQCGQLLMFVFSQICQTICQIGFKTILPLMKAL